MKIWFIGKNAQIYKKSCKVNNSCILTDHFYKNQREKY
jgi:hypothetical protein